MGDFTGVCFDFFVLEPTIQDLTVPTGKPSWIYFVNFLLFRYRYFFLFFVINYYCLETCLSLIAKPDLRPFINSWVKTPGGVVGNT